LSLVLVGNGYTVGIGSWSAYKYFLLKGVANNKTGADNPNKTDQKKCGLV
jgi:hypothetical protein